MDRSKRWLFVAVFLVSLAGVCLLGAAMGTEYWVVARPVRRVDTDTIWEARNVSGGALDTKFRGYIHFGLFNGYKELDHGLGVRKGKIEVVADASDHGLFDLGLWVSTIVFLVLAIILGLVTMGFSALNAAIRPIETITGPAGLYLWNALAMLFSALSFVLYIVLYFKDYRDNVLTPEDISIYSWTSAGLSELNFSFYLVVVATGLFAGNIAVMLLSGFKWRPTRYSANVNEKAMDGVMMY